MTTIWTSPCNPAEVKRDERGGLRFCYRPVYHTSCGLCEFSLLCEVGDMYKKWFDDFLKLYSLNEQPVKYDEPPWLADQLQQPLRAKECKHAIGVARPATTEDAAVLRLLRRRT